jgi:DNA-binding CsgD family transcriptional regulator
MSYVAITDVRSALRRIVPGREQAILSLLKPKEISSIERDLDFTKPVPVRVCPLKLTPMERELCVMLLQGKTYADIGAITGKRPHTIYNAVMRINMRTGCKGRQHLVYWLKINMSKEFDLSC